MRKSWREGVGRNVKGIPLSLRYPCFARVIELHGMARDDMDNSTATHLSIYHLRLLLVSHIVLVSSHRLVFASRRPVSFSLFIVSSFVLSYRLAIASRLSTPLFPSVPSSYSSPIISPVHLSPSLPFPIALILLHRRIAFSSPAALFISPHHHYPMRKRADENGASFVSSNGTLTPPSPRPTMTDDNRERNTQPRDERNETTNDEPPPWT